MSGADHDAITALVRDYTRGMAQADEALLRGVFHPSACIVGNYDGAVEWLTLDDFVAGTLAQGPVAPGHEPFWEILSVDRTPDTAVVRMLDDYAGLRFTDHLSLLSAGGHWRIVHKLYHLHADAAAEDGLMPGELNASNDD